MWPRNSRARSKADCYIQAEEVCSRLIRGPAEGVGAGNTREEPPSSPT